MMSEYESRSSRYRVDGMSCGHCAAAVSEELESVDGIETVDVDVDDGIVEVVGAGFGEDDVRDAVAAAGYELVAKV